MSKIQDLLSDKNHLIDYNQIINQYPWVISRNQNCILSPDSDGLLCGLFMSSVLGWKIRGFYDGKAMLIENGYSAKDCVFLDMEVFRKEIKSIGHHMVLYNKKIMPEHWDNYKNCIQPNVLRGYDGKNDFRLKYPLATIHLLIGIVGSRINLKIPESAICPLFFTDGTFNVLFKYPENVLNWLKFLRANEENNPLKKIFENEKYSVYTLMLAMDDFFRRRDEISIHKERGDRLRISETDGEPVNIELTNNDKYKLKSEARIRIIKFMQILSELTGWSYKDSEWTWENYKLHKFSKKDFAKDKLSVCNRNYSSFIEKMPLSWAMTSNQNIEYTLESPDKMV